MHMGGCRDPPGTSLACRHREWVKGVKETSPSVSADRAQSSPEDGEPDDHSPPEVSDDTNRLGGCDEDSGKHRSIPGIKPSQDSPCISPIPLPEPRTRRTSEPPEPTLPSRLARSGTPTTRTAGYIAQPGNVGRAPNLKCATFCYPRQIPARQNPFRAGNVGVPPGPIGQLRRPPNLRATPRLCGAAFAAHCHQMRTPAPRPRVLSSGRRRSDT